MKTVFSIVISLFSVFIIFNKAKCNDFPIDKEFFSYTFKTDSSLIYKVVLEKYSENDSALFSILLKNNIEVDRNQFELEKYYFFERCKLSKVIDNPEIDDVRELVIIDFYEDNSDDTGEADEYFQSDKKTMLFGYYENKIIEEIFTTSTDYFEYGSESFYPDSLVFYEYYTTKNEHLVFPADTNGLKNRIVLISEQQHKVISEHMQVKDSCHNYYHALNVLLFQDGKFVYDPNYREHKYRLKEGVVVPVYSSPNICYVIDGEIEGDFDLLIVEKSTILTSILVDEEEVKGYWLKIKSPNDTSSEFAYVFSSYLIEVDK
jgi:hypothetical protein